MSMTVEQRVSDTISEKRMVVTLGGREYEVAPPTIGTLVMMSAKVSEFQPYKVEGMIGYTEMLADAADGRLVAEVVSILILGAKRIRGDRFTRFLHRDRVSVLADELLLNATPKEMNEAVLTIFSSMEIKDFFALTTFLREISLTQRTRKVDEATPSGQ